jgi:ABC-type transport system involved in multi-copper enzyme maturation permease subunit
LTEIHDQSYRRYRGKRAGAGSAWSIIASHGVLSMVRKRVFIGLLLFAWIPFVVRAVQIYLSVNFQQMPIPIQIKAETFREFLDQQGLFVFFVTIWVGAGLIANDRRANALQIYLSKPLTRGEYILGKLAVLMTFLLLVTWLPAMLLLLLQTILAGSFAFIRANLYLLPAITLFSLLLVLVSATAMLAMSALSNSSRFVGILYAGIVLFTDAMFNVLRVITGGSAVSWVSFSASLEQIGDLIFRVPLRYETPWPVSLVALAGLVAVSLSVLERRVRGVEVVT